jgi:hypothetical protein
MSAGREAAPGSRKGGDDANLNEPKMKKIHMVDSTGTNGR